MTKRGKGKNKGALGPIYLYKFYLNKCKLEKKEPVSRKDFSLIIDACNTELIRVCTEESEIVRLPMRLGYLQVCKHERSFSKRSDKMSVDWKLTKEHGFRVLHEQRYIYKWMWLKRTSLVKNKTKYKFQASRAAKRLVPKKLSEGKDYYGQPTKY